MFRSRRRAIVYSQYEHARLAGMLAQHWGNARFPQPPLPFESFVAGVSLHDFGYGLVDEHSIGEMGHSERLMTLEALIDARLSDQVAETVALFHARRLIGDASAALAARCEVRIDALLAATGISRASHEAADRITDLCDSVAFHFCFEHAHAGHIEVPMAEETASARIDWKFDGEEEVVFAPWPFDLTSLELSVVAFESVGYPQSLVPRAVFCQVRPG